MLVRGTAVVAGLLTLGCSWAFSVVPLRPSLLCGRNAQSAFSSRSNGPLAHRLSQFSRPRRASTITMGIPKLFRWLTDQYPSVNQRISEGLSKDQQEIDNLYLDMNGIIHMCTHGNADDVVILREKEMLQRIFTYTDRIYKIVRPKRVFYLAVDGVAPRAKMNQQRSRRFRSSKEQEQLMAELVARTDGPLPDEADRFDSNCITPGTEFMYKLGIAFRKWVAFKLENDAFWKENGAMVIFSGPDVPGEGEHKVMDYVRRAREEDPGWTPQLRHIFYGLDADLIMLSLVTHEKNFMLLREKMSVRHSRGGRPKDPINYVREDFELLEISLLRKMLSLQFKDLENPEKYQFKLELERLIDDFVFICMFVGNDFLPHIPNLDIADGSLNLMMNNYKDLLPVMGGYMTDKGRIHLPRLELFFRELSRYEPAYFKHRAQEEQNEAMGAEDYKDHYYQSKFGWAPHETDKRRQLVEDYIAGLYWVLEYYHNGVGSWDWYYPHLYAPLVSDLVNLATVKTTFSDGEPFTPLMQLLSVLPAQSGRFLPAPYRELMTEEASPLAEFFPKDFETDLNGKRNSWESVVLIPFLDEKRMVETLRMIDHKKDLTPQERLRNILGCEHAYSLVGGEVQCVSTPGEKLI